MCKKTNSPKMTTFFSYSHCTDSITANHSPPAPAIFPHPPPPYQSSHVLHSPLLYLVVCEQHSGDGVGECAHTVSSLRQVIQQLSAFLLCLSVCDRLFVSSCAQCPITLSLLPNYPRHNSNWQHNHKEKRMKICYVHSDIICGTFFFHWVVAC